MIVVIARSALGGNMQKLLSMIVLMLSLPALAADDVAHPPAEPVSVVFVAIFAVLFVGMIAGFFVYLWWLEKHKKQDQA
jgi:hypothetical protein